MTVASGEGALSDRIFVSSGAFQAPSLSGVLAECNGCSVENLELSSGLHVESSEHASIVEQCSGMRRLLVHNYFPPPKRPFTLNLASENDEIHQQSVDLARSAIDLCRLLNTPFYSIHAGIAIDLPPSLLGRPEEQTEFADSRKIDRCHALSRFRETVVDLAGYAHTRGVGLLLENNVVTEEQVAGSRENPLLLADPIETRKFFEDMPSAANVGLLLDLGHLRVSAQALSFDPQQAFVELLPYVGAFHVSWNDGVRDTNEPIPEDAWFLSELATVPQVPVVLEAYDLSCAEIEQQLVLLHRAIDSTTTVSR